MIARGRSTRWALLAALLAVVALCSGGCAFHAYVSGDATGRIPESDWNVNLVLLGARGGSGTRTSIWCPLVDYESFDGGVKVRALGPMLPNALGYINLKGETGFVTPVFSSHWGNLDSICLGPLFLPVFRYDSHSSSDYWATVILGALRLHSYRPGHLNLISLSLLWPVFHYESDDASSYWKCGLLGLIHFGSDSVGIGTYTGARDGPPPHVRPMPIFHEYYHAKSANAEVHVADSWDW